MTSAFRIPYSRKAHRPRLKCTVVLSWEGAAICGIQASEAAHEFEETRIRGCELGELQRPYRVLSLKSAPPSVEVHGGVSSEGAAIFGIQASEAADEFSGPRIRGCELGNCSAPTQFRKRTALG